MTDNVSADADPVIDYAGNRLQSVIELPHQQSKKGQSGWLERDNLALVSRRARSLPCR
jgi:hypothetical protein